MAAKEEATQDDREEVVGLRCLRGAAPPRHMARDLASLLTLSEPARQELRGPLCALLGLPPYDDAQRALADYCGQFDLEPSDVAPALKATGQLLRESARANIATKELSADLHVLAEEEQAEELAALLLPWFEQLGPELRTELIRQSVLDHGKLVVGAHWRVERITSSDRGEWLNTKIGLLTFSYREGNEERRVTLHLLPEQIATLRTAATEMLE